ncbi:hypothetical protein KCP74_24095 [Salmonella enterica subsp. enterica]|nr:hypothetical protein KCP74_24095 [Salmonella enterica subsp. enterica]
MVSEAIAAGDIQAINYCAQKYTGSVTANRSANNSVVMMPLDASSLDGRYRRSASWLRTAPANGKHDSDDSGASAYSA